MGLRILQPPHPLSVTLPSAMFLTPSRIRMNAMTCADGRATSDRPWRTGSRCHGLSCRPSPARFSEGRPLQRRQAYRRLCNNPGKGTRALKTGAYPVSSSLYYKQTKIFVCETIIGCSAHDQPQRHRPQCLTARITSSGRDAAVAGSRAAAMRAIRWWSSKYTQGTQTVMNGWTPSSLSERTL